MNIAICDDEKVIIKQVRDMIIGQLADCQISEYESGKELLSSGKSFDIIFLDIQMENMNGIQAAKELRKKEEDSIIIFITALKEYVFDAFDVSAFHYILKPIEADKINEVLKRALEKIRRRDSDKKRQIFIKTRYMNRTLNVDEILYMENQKRKVIIYTEKEKIEFYAVMSELKEQVGERFYRSHRGYLVNMAYIAEYNMDTIWLSNGNRVYLSKDKYQDFVKQYMRYLRNGGVSHA